MALKLPSSVKNWISLIGATIALVSLFMIIFLFVISVFLGQGGLYLGLVIYILLPAFLIAGLILIPVGMIVQVRRERKLEKIERPPWPRIDLNDPHHRNAFVIFSVGTAIFLLMSAIGSYEAFHYTESVEFCGKLCHSVMKPEYTAYQHSPHAKVACVDCHVGPGADWYVRSKLSGAYQVYATLADVYPQPIPTPIKNLRPAREVCEQCHWPQKFYAQELRLETHYLPDEQNTRWNIRLVMKIGSEHPALGLKEGIHWHINPDVQIQYIPTDEAREDIPWVKYTNLKTGQTIIYQDENNPIDQAQLDTLETRTMECIDCHNRPSHNYRSPSAFINAAITADEIPAELPNIKSFAVELCAKEYSSIDSALQYIEDETYRYYKENYPEIYSQKEDLITKAIEGIQTGFSQNIFPVMKTRWDVHKNHIGHLEYKGCFRCHNGNHVSENNDRIRRDCNLCHYINAQGTPGNMQVAVVEKSLEFKHPEDIGEAWKEMLCSDCHSGVNP